MLDSASSKVLNAFTFHTNFFAAFKKFEDLKEHHRNSKKDRQELKYSDADEIIFKNTSNHRDDSIMSMTQNNDIKSQLV